MRKAFVLGFKHYIRIGNFDSVVNSAEAIAHQLTTNRGRDKNFDVNLWTDRRKSPYTDSESIETAISDFFAQGTKDDVAMFYFVGHGGKKDGKQCIIFPGQYVRNYYIPMSWLLQKAQDSPIGNIIIVLDCCFSGAMGGRGYSKQLRPGISILTSTSEDLEAMAFDNRVEKYTLFSGLFKEALMGRGGDKTGVVSLASIYHFVCQSLGHVHQPALRCNADLFIPIKFLRTNFDDDDVRIIHDGFWANDQRLWPDGSGWLSAYTQRFDLYPDMMEELKAKLHSLEERNLVIAKTGTTRDGRTIEFYILSELGKRLWDMKENQFFE